MVISNSQHIYRQIGDRICETIIRQEWRAGEKIPSVRDMAVESEVNPNTVMRTYSYLQDQGIIFNKRGIGYFVAEDAAAIARKIKRAEFVDHDLPQIFNLMDLLDMHLTDLELYYDKYQETIKRGTTNENNK